MTTTHPKSLPRTRATRPTRREPRPQRRRWLGWAVTAAVAVIAVALVAIGGRTDDAPVAAAAAPDFELATTSGTPVKLSDLAGQPVLLYFNEGAGCDVCFTQTVKLEADEGFQRAGVTLVPVVMNPLSTVRAQLGRFSIRTAYAIDPGGVTSRAYDTLGKGHHAQLPGHTFVLVGPDGQLRWRGDYPDMWVEPAELTAAVTGALR